MKGSPFRWLGLGALLVATAVQPSVAGPGGPKGAGPPGGPGRPARVLVREAGQPFCPSSALVYGTTVIPGGRCYTLAILHDVRGTFLAFLAPDARIPPGQLVRLTTPAGPKLRGRIFFLVPVQTTVVVIPVNTITLVATRIEDFGPRLAVVVVGTPAPNLTVVFSVQL